MASAKKGKKNKGKTLALSDFLQETPGSVPTVPIRKSTTNWADEVEDNHDVYDSRSAKTSVILPTAPKASRDLDDITDKVPQDPPFIAYLTNLPYDVDEDEIAYFFRNMKIAHMRIPKDDRGGEAPRLKGFGYVEFEDRDSLLNALVIQDTTIKTRRIRIEVATDYNNDNRRSGRMDMNRDRGNRGESSFGDWRSGPRQESSADTDRRGFSRDRDREREGSDTSGAWREGGDRRPNRDTDRPFTRSNDRFREDRDQEITRSRDDKFTPRRFDGDRGGNRDRYDGDRGGNRDRYDGGRAGNRDRYDGDRDRGGNRDRNGGGGGFTRNAPPSRDREQEDSSRGRDMPRERPKLMLTPRTKPVENESDKVASTTSIFGAAKPVDTAARERQIEERLAKDQDPPKREASRERKEEESVSVKEKKEKQAEPVAERKPADRPEKTSQDLKSDVNGVIEKSHNPNHSKRNDSLSDDNEKKEVKADSGDKQKSDVKKREDKKEKTEKEMPKLKKADPPNFVASNKFAYLENEDGSD